MSKADDLAIDLIKLVKYIFHKHDYQIAVTSGIATIDRFHFISNYSDKVEIKCYCSKCGKVFKTYTI